MFHVSVSFTIETLIFNMTVKTFIIERIVKMPMVVSGVMLKISVSIVNDKDVSCFCILCSALLDNFFRRNISIREKWNYFTNESHVVEVTIFTTISIRISYNQ